MYLLTEVIYISVTATMKALQLDKRFIERTEKWNVFFYPNIYIYIKKSIVNQYLRASFGIKKLTLYILLYHITV